MQNILEELHRKEREDIKNVNLAYAKQINDMTQSNTPIEAKVQALCNVTARFFMMKRAWFMTNPHNLESVEPIITSNWNQIKSQASSEMRKISIEKCIRSADETTKTEFIEYADEILPM